MRTAYEAVLYGNIEAINYPLTLKECCTGHVHLVRVQTYSVLVSHLVHVIIIYYNIIVYLLCAAGWWRFRLCFRIQSTERRTVCRELVDSE